MPMAPPKPARWCSARIRKGLPQPEMSVGYPHPQVALRLVDGDNRDAEQGVLEMKCPAVMLGYHNRPDVRAAAHAGRLLHHRRRVPPRRRRLLLFRRPHRRHVRVRRREHLSGRRRAHAGAPSRRGAGRGGADRRRDQGAEAGRLRHPQSRPRARAKTKSSDSRWPMRRPISIRASSGSSTNCRSPRPTRSTARRCSTWRRSGSADDR